MSILLCPKILSVLLWKIVKKCGIWTPRFFQTKHENISLGDLFWVPKCFRMSVGNPEKHLNASKFGVEEGLTKATEEGNGALGDHFGCSKAHDTHLRDREWDDFRGPGRTWDQKGGVGERLWKCVLQFFVPSAFWLVLLTNKHRFLRCLDTSLIDVGNAN